MSLKEIKIDHITIRIIIEIDKVIIIIITIYYKTR